MLKKGECEEPMLIAQHSASAVSGPYLNRLLEMVAVSMQLASGIAKTGYPELSTAPTPSLAFNVCISA